VRWPGGDEDKSIRITITTKSGQPKNRTPRESPASASATYDDKEREAAIGSVSSEVVSAVLRFLVQESERSHRHHDSGAPR